MNDNTVREEIAGSPAGVIRALHPGQRPDEMDEPFYARVMSETDRVALREARRVGGLGEEVALLRAMVRRAVGAQPDDLKAIESGVRLVMQLVVSHRKLAPEEGDGLALALARVFEGLDISADDVD
jgi:hypothetical protein